MNRRSALRSLFGGAVALAVAPVDAIRRFAALEPQNYLADGFSAARLSELVHEIFVEHVRAQFRRDSAVVELFCLSAEEPPHTEGICFTFTTEGVP